MIDRITVRTGNQSWHMTPEEFDRVKPDLRNATSIETREMVTWEELQARMDEQNGYAWRIYDTTMPDRRTGFMPHRTQAEAQKMLDQLSTGSFMEDYGIRREKE